MTLSLMHNGFLMLYLVALLIASQPASPPALTVTFGDPAQNVALTKEALAKLPRKTIKVTEGDGTATEYEGTPLEEVLKLAKVPMGSELRGRSVAPVAVVAQASDGGKAVFALAEIEPSFSDRLIIVADKRDGKPLVADEGPYRLVIPTDKRHARWLRQVKEFTVKKL